MAKSLPVVQWRTIWKLSSSYRVTPDSINVHSGQSSAWDHFRGDIDDPCGVIADFCGVIADPCGVVAIPEAIGRGTVADSAMPIVQFGRRMHIWRIYLSVPYLRKKLYI